jgi:selenocysteine-specific elongation factor
VSTTSRAGATSRASVVVGTAGHIDHGKTTLLRALTGIDADRLPEERRRGMTIDVGYAHLALPDGGSLDFVDVPGHDRLVGNMLVGAGEIDAALLVVAADDGPSAQTLEHLELLDALGIGDGLVAVTKADLAGEARAGEVAAAMAALVGRTTLAGSPVHMVSSTTGAGIDGLRAALAALADRVAARLAAEASSGGPRLAIDRAFRVRGRGVVVTGSLRGGRVATGDALRLVPGDRDVRVREVQAHGAQVAVSDGGRTALLLAGVELAEVPRGAVLTTDPAVVATSRVMVAMRGPAGLAPTARGRRLATDPPADRDRLRLHLGTAQADALVVRGPREAIDLPDGASLAILRLDQPVAAAPGDRFALRRPSPGSAAGGGVIVDPLPARGVSRRRLTPQRAAALAADPHRRDARLDLHGSLVDVRGRSLAGDVADALASVATRLVAEHQAAHPESAGIPLPALRQELARTARRLVTLDRAAADAVAQDAAVALISGGVLARDGELVRDPARAAGLPPGVLAAMDRLEAALAVAAPPPLAEAAGSAGCPPQGVKALEAANRIVRLQDNLAWAATTYRELSRQALTMAAAGPLSPAAFRDVTGTSRKYVLVILEDLDRRGLLRRTDAGHVLGPKTLARLAERAARRAGGGEGATS